MEGEAGFDEEAGVGETGRTSFVIEVVTVEVVEAGEEEEEEVVVVVVVVVFL